MDGVHLEAVGVNKWKLTGEASVVGLQMEERVLEGKPTIKWVVRDGGVEARYSTAMVALSHAYQLAKGHTARQAAEY